jgi:rfaE bifunctional protein nucleotidyltransferase chain/domain
MENYRLKIKALEQARTDRDTLKVSGERIVFTNGCFDLLHPGHTRYLYAARGLGDHLIVGLNSDRSVRAIKGPGRPVLVEQARAEVLSALECVDTVVVFDEDNPLEVIKHLMPDILVKGGDWAEDEIIGADIVIGAGGEVRRIPYISGFSSTDIIKRIIALSVEIR